MREPRSVAATFPDLPGLLEALKGLRRAGCDRFSVYSPVGLEEYEDLLPRRGSPVRWFTLAAGLAGCVLGFWLCIGSARLYSLIVSGKPVLSWVPYCVIGFEVTILAAGLVTVAAALLLGRLYPRGTAADYDPSFSADRFGVSVPCPEGECASVIELLRSAGARGVREF